MAHHHDVEDAIILVGELVLPQLADPLVDIERDVASGRFELATEDAHEGGLAAAIGANEAVAITTTKFDRDVFEQGLFAELQGETSGAEQTGLRACYMEKWVLRRRRVSRRARMVPAF